MTPGTYNITIYQGSTFSRLFTWKDSGGSTIDLSTYSARMKIRLGSKTGGQLLSLVSPSNIALAATSPNITVTIAASVTDSLLATTGYYDLELESSSGTVYRLLQGTVTIDQSVTK